MADTPAPGPAIAAAMFNQAQQAALTQLRVSTAAQLLGFLLVGHVAYPKDPDLDDPGVRVELAGQAVQWGDELLRVVMRTPFKSDGKPPVM
jgi:hypothetical protein